jgi:hypothetical protein
MSDQITTGKRQKAEGRSITIEAMPDQITTGKRQKAEGRRKKHYN